VKVQAFFLFVGRNAKKIDDSSLVIATFFLFFNILFWLLAVTNQWATPAGVWILFQWGNGICAVFLLLRSLVFAILYNTTPPHSEIQMTAICGGLGGLLWLGMSQSVTTGSSNEPSPWGIVPVILLVVYCIVLTSEIRDYLQRVSALPETSNILSEEEDGSEDDIYQAGYRESSSKTTQTRSQHAPAEDQSVEEHTTERDLLELSIEFQLLESVRIGSLSR
jgi:hypothetical protein